MTSSAFSSKQKPLVMVMEQARSQQEAIAQRLQTFLDYVANEEKQQALLQEYKKEYEEKIHGQQQGLVSDIVRYRTFYHQLDTLLMQQQQKITLAHSQVIELQKALQLQQHKIQVLHEMIEKRHAEHQWEEEKKLQKMCDELSANQYARQQNEKNRDV